MMVKGFISIDDLSEYLGVKKTTLYSFVESGDLPHYRFGRLIRFKTEEVDAWTEAHREGSIDSNRKGKETFRGSRGTRIDVDQLVRRSIESVKSRGYTPSHGKPDQVKGLRKEVEHGSL